MATSKTEQLLFSSGHHNNIHAKCSIERNGCFTVSSDTMSLFFMYFGTSNPEKIKITRKCGEVMKLDKLRKRDNRWLIWPVEHQYGRRGKNKKFIERLEQARADIQEQIRKVETNGN